MSVLFLGFIYQLILGLLAFYLNAKMHNREGRPDFICGDMQPFHQHILLNSLYDGLTIYCQHQEHAWCGSIEVIGSPLLYVCYGTHKDQHLDL